MKNIYPSILKSLLCVTQVIILIGCASTQWRVSNRPTQSAIQSILLHNDYHEIWDLHLLDQQDFEIPDNLRPCCAFGVDQKIKLGKIKLPFVSVSNIVDPKNLGIHIYNANYFSHSKISSNKKQNREKNGLLYTVRGGLIDTAHVRDTADLTVALFYRIYKHLGESKTIYIKEELGTINLILDHFDVESLTRRQKWELSADIAALQAFQMAVLHEIAQHYGYHKIPLYPEFLSAYSPEDLYSNLLGAKLGKSLILANLIHSSDLYNTSMTEWFNQTLQWLVPVTPQHTKKLLKSKDQVWWDSSKRMPDKYYLLKRNYNVSARQHPLMIERDPSLTPVTLRLNEESYGFKIRDISRLHTEVDQEYHSNFKSVPAHYWKNGISCFQFQKVVEHSHLQNKHEMKRD